MIAFETYEEWERDALQRGREKGIAEGREKGIAAALLDIYEARFGDVPAELRSCIEMKSGAVLREWLRLAATGSREQVDQAIRNTSR